ncbi:MAG: hypothetical protein ABI622_08825 [Chloroflexota bacterium]
MQDDTTVDTITTNADLGPLKQLDFPDEHVLAVDTEKRQMRLRVLRYDEVVTHPAYGRMLFQRGVFGAVDPSQVRARMDHEDPPTGLGIAYEDLPDAPYLTVRISKTQRGDEQLTLARDGVSRGTSPGFRDIPGRPQQKFIDGLPTTVYGPNSAVLGELSTTWMPTFSGDGVMSILHSQEKGSGPTMAEDTQAPATGVITPGMDYEKLTAAIVAANADHTRDEKLDKALGAFDQMIELQRAQFNVPKGEARKPKLSDWVEITLRRMRGEAIPSALIKELALDDVVTTEQPGLVPNLLVPDYDDLISQSRPFLGSTRQIAPPATGTSMLLPIITTRAVAGTQAGSAEKGVLTTTATKVGTGTFPYVSVFGGADISIQMIQRADRSFFDLLTGDMGEAYALDSEEKAIAALLAGYTPSSGGAKAPTNGGVLDPENPFFGVAWQNSILACKRAPTHIWMSASAVGAFIDAKAPLTNAPLYSTLAAAFTAGGGTGGTLSGLTPIYVPALDGSAVDVIVGPSRGFVWAEDKALNLQADVPSTAGRDIALVGGIFPAPRNADAFTTYTVAS